MRSKNKAACFLLAVLFGFMGLAVPAQASQQSSFIVGMVCSAGATINPYLCTQRDLISMNELVFESLVEFDEEFKPVGELALTWTKSGKDYVFKIRDNVRFHDGTYLSAQDVYQAYRYIISLGEKSPYYSRCRYISSMEVTDLYTVTVTGKYDSLLTLYAMTFPIAQRNTLSWDLPCGTGPYWYMSYDLEWMQIDANPYWWKKAPVIDSVYGFRYDETGDALTALSTGEIDAFATRSQTAALGRLLSDRTSVDYTTLTYEMLIPNFNSVYFENISTRKAIMYAIDIPTIAANTYMDMVTESEVPVIPGSWLYETQSAIYFESQERALQLLYEAGWGDYDGDGILDKVVDGILRPFEFTILTYVDDTAGIRTHAAELIRDQLRPLGIAVNVETSTKSSVDKKLKKGEFDMVLAGVNMSLLPDLTFLLNSDGRMNYSGYADSEMDDLLDSLYEYTDEGQFQLLFSKIQLKIVDELPFMGLFFRKGTLMVAHDVTGLMAFRETDALRGIEYIEFH